MNSLVIPPPPNWYETSILACAPDNTLIYGSRNDIVVIQDTPNDQPADVRIIPRAHSQKIICTNINRNWGQPNKLLVTVAEDKIIKLWNIDLMERKLAHNEHANHGKVIGATFAGDEKVISVSEDGAVIVWNTSINQTNTLRDLFGSKVTVTCLSTCPHATWLTAFGLKIGLVVIADLRREGKVLYKLRGHDKSVLSLTWCPAPVNIFPRDPNNYVGTKGKNKSFNHDKDAICKSDKSKQLDDESEKSKINNSKNTLFENKDESSPKQNYDKKNPWIGLKHADDDDFTQDSRQQDETHLLLKVYEDDFLKECETLKNRILGTSSPVADITGVLTVEKTEKHSDDLNKETDITTKCKENAVKSEINGERVISLCEYKDSLEKYRTVKATENFPNDLVAIKTALTETKSGDTNNKISEEKGTVPPDVASASVIEDKCDYIDHESIKEKLSSGNKSETLSDKIKLTSTSTDESTEHQEKSMTEVSSAEDNSEELDKLPGEIKGKSDIVEEASIEDDSEVLSSGKKQMTSTKSGKESDGTEGKSFAECAPNDLVDVEVKETALTETKSGDRDNKISREKETIPPDIASGSVIEDKCDDIDGESIKEKLSSGYKSKTLSDEIKLTSTSTDESNEHQEKSMKEVSSAKDNSEGFANIVEECSTGDDSEMLRSGKKQVTPTKSENESDGKEGKSFTEEVPSTLITTTVAAMDCSDSNKKKNITANDSSEDDSEAPEEHQRVNEEPRKEFLLASSGREGNIYIWRAGTDGRMQTFLCPPNKSNHRKFGRQNPDKVWIVLCWVTPNILLSSSKSAELIRWNLPKPKDPSRQYVVIHNDHSSLLFSIAAPIIRLDESNWSDKIIDGKRRQLSAWTVGQDRLLLNTSLEKERKNLACYPTVGRAECFAESPIDSNRLAIGTGEGVIKLWDVSRPHVKNIVMTNFYQKIQGKVVTMAWHPHNEMILAYGTSEGRVGYMDTNKKKPPTLLPNFFKSQIHKIEWGPMNGNVEQIGLFVVSEGKLVVFETETPQKEPLEVDTPDNTYVYTFAWKPNYEVLLVTTKAGAVITYSVNLKILSTQYLQHKLQNIYWHSSAMFDYLEMSKYCGYFAAISNFKELIVYNSAIKTDISEERVVAKYTSNGEMINGAAWNPYSQSEIVIVRDDGVAQVWDVDTNTVVSTYINPNFDGLLAVIWSPREAQFIITASKDHTIKIWNKSDFPAKSEKEISDLRKALIKKISNEASDLLPKAEKPQEDIVKVKKSSKNNLLPNFYLMRSNTSQIIADLKKLLLWKEGESRESLDDGNDGPNILDIFDSSACMLKIIEQNETILRQKGKYHLDTMLSLFKGDIGTAIKAAIDEKRVTPWVLMMAPMVSHKVWHTACEVYAQQLSVEPDSDPLEIATLYLMCHKLEEAIKTLCEAALYREALALAKCRLTADDPTITNIIEQWAKHSLIVGNFETSAQCNIFLGKYEAAASVLFRRSDVETLKFAVELAEKSGNEELHQAVLFRYNSFAKEKKISENEKDLPTKAEAILQKEQAEKNEEEVVLLQKSDGDERIESHESQELNGIEDDGRKDEKFGLLQRSDEDERKESHEPKEMNSREEDSPPTKFEISLSKEQAGRDDKEVELSQKSERDVVELQEVNDSVPTKDELIFPKAQTEVNDEKFRLLQKSNGEEEIEKQELQEVHSTEQKSASTEAKAVPQKELERNFDKVRSLQKVNGGDKVESHELHEVNDNEQNSVSDANTEKKSVSDECTRKIEDRIGKENVEYEENIKNVSIDFGVTLSDEKCTAQSGGLLTTEEVKKLLSSSKLEFLNDSEVEPVDLNKNSSDKCY